VTCKTSAKFDHNWRLLGRRVSPVLRDAMATIMEEAVDLRGPLSPFRRVALGELPGRPAASRIAATAHTEFPENGNIGKDPMGLFAMLQRRAHETVKKMCKAEIVDSAEVRARVGRGAKRFTDIVANPITAERFADPAAGQSPFVYMAADLLGIEGLPPTTLHGLRINPYRRAKPGMLYCVNRRNMLLGLGDGELSYDYERGRYCMSVTCAFDVSRAPPGLSIRVVTPKSRELPMPPAPRAGQGGRVAARLGRDWSLLDRDAAGPFLRELHAAMMERESVYLRGLQSLFTAVDLSEIQDPRAIRKMTARTGPLNPPADPNAGPRSRRYRHWKTLNLFERLNREALRAIVGMCTGSARVADDDLDGWARGLEGRFTDVIANPSVSLYGGSGALREVVESLLAGGRGASRRRAGGRRALEVHKSRWIRSPMAYCINRRNLAIGLGDGKFWYDRGSKRAYMSVRYAFDTHRAPPGLKVRVTGMPRYG